MDVGIEKFKFSGHVYIWKYPQLGNYPGWNITFDKVMGAELTSLLKLMERSEWPSKKIIATTIPTEQADKSLRDQAWKSKPELLLNFKKLSDPAHWILTSTANHLEIQFGSSKFKELIKAIDQQMQGINDFAIADSAENNILYFW